MRRFCDLAVRKSQRSIFLLLSLLCFFVSSPITAQADSGQYFYDPGSRATGVLDSVNGTAQYTFDKSGNINAITKNSISSLTVLQASPSAGPIGGTITISGTGFGTVSNTSVKFNGTSATPTAVTSTLITVTVPAGATTGNLSVTAPLGTVTLAAPFTVLPSGSPTITSFTTGTSTPTIAPIGASVTITGTNFDTTYSKVLVNGQFAQVTSATSTTLVITVPPSSSGKLIVQTPIGSVTSSSDLIIAPPSYAATSVTALRTTVGASPATITNGSTGTVSLGLFDATAGQKITTFVNVNSEPGCPNFSLLMPNGSNFTLNASSCGYYFIGPLIFPQAGTYSLELSSASAGSFQIQAFNVPPNVTQTVTIGGSPESLTITEPGQQGNFTFSGTNGQKISTFLNVTLSGLGCGYYTLFNPDNTVLAGPTLTCGNDWVSSPVILSQTGTYTLNITPNLSGPGDGTGTATVTLFNVPSNVTQSATIGGSAASLTLTEPGQQGNFTFAGTSGQTISTFLNLSRLSESTCTAYTVFNPDSTVLIGPTNDCGASSWGSSPFVLPQTGTYTLNLNPALNIATDGTGTIAVTLYNVPANATQSATIGGSAASLTLTEPGQQGNFTFAGTSGQTISTFLNLSRLSESTCTAYTVFNPDSTVLIGPTNDCGASSWGSSPFVLPQTGTYTLNLNPALNIATDGTGTVATTLFLVPAAATNTVTVGGGEATVHITTPGQLGWFKFSGTSGSAYTTTMDFSGMTTPCYTFSILNPDSTIFNGPSFNCNSYSTGSLTVSQTGTFKIVISPDLSAGTLTAGTGTAGATVTHP